jgi:hypothetical protein
VQATPSEDFLSYWNKNYEELISTLKNLLPSGLLNALEPLFTLYNIAPHVKQAYDIYQNPEELPIPLLEKHPVDIAKKPENLNYCLRVVQYYQREIEVLKQTIRRLEDELATATRSSTPSTVPARVSDQDLTDSSTRSSTPSTVPTRVSARSSTPSTVPARVSARSSTPSRVLDGILDSDDVGPLTREGTMPNE